MPIKKTSIHLSTYRQPICPSSVYFSHLPLKLYHMIMKGKQCIYMCDHHLVVIAQPQRKLTPTPCDQ